MLQIITFVLVVAFFVLLSQVLSLKKRVSALNRHHGLEAKVELLIEENKRLNRSINTLIDDKYKLTNALAKWEILSYENMTDMIFSSYMATKSPETSGKAIIAAIEKRISK